MHLGYEFFNFWNELKFLGLQSINFYILSISALIYSIPKQKKADPPNT